MSNISNEELERSKKYIENRSKEFEKMMNDPEYKEQEFQKYLSEMDSQIDKIFKDDINTAFTAGNRMEVRNAEYRKKGSDFWLQENIQELNEFKSDIENLENGKDIAPKKVITRIEISKEEYNRLQEEQTKKQNFSQSYENKYSNDRLKNAQYEYDVKMHTPSGTNPSMVTTANDISKKFASVNLNSNKYTNNTSTNKTNSNVSFGNARAYISNENRYSSDKLKNAQYEYEVKMHTPSALVAKLNSNADLTGVIGAKFGSAAKNVAATGFHSIGKTAREMAQMGMGAVANDEGSRKVADALKYTTMTTAAAFGDIKDIGDKSMKAMKNASNLAAGMELKGLSQINKNTLMTHWGKSDITKLGEMELRKGCISYLRSKGFNISEDLLKGNTAKVITKLNKIIKITSDKEVIVVLNALKGSVIKTPLNKPKKFNFRLLHVGMMIGSNLKYKFLSNEDMKGLSVLIQTKDRVTAVVKTILRFFYSVAKAGQKGAALARRATLLLKKTKLYEKIYNLRTQKLITKYYKNFGKKGTKGLAKQVRKRTSKAAGKSIEKGAKLGLRAQMITLRNTIVKKVVGTAVKKFVATKVGQFVVTKIGESAVFHVLQAILTDWIPVVGQIKFVAEIVVIVLMVIFIVFVSVQVKTVIDDIGNAASYHNEALTDYGETLKNCSAKYKAFYKDVINKDANGTLQSHSVPKLISRMTDNLNVQFADYMAVDSYNTATVDGQNLRELYGNQPELIMMAHIMSEMGLDTSDIDVKQKYNNQLTQWYNTSHIMYLSYFQEPNGIENNHPYATPYDQIYEQDWNEDKHCWEIQTETIKILDYVDSQGPHFHEEEVEKVIGSCRVYPDALKVTWHANFGFDTYYYDNLFDYSEAAKADFNSQMYEPQVYISFPNGANSVHSSKFLPINNPAAKEIMPKVYTAVSDKLDEKHIYNANTMAITCGIVANLICEGGCLGNNYEDSWEQKQNVTDLDVTDYYNSCFYKDYNKNGELLSDIDSIWNNVKNEEKFKGTVIKDKKGKDIKWYAGGYGIVQWTDEGRKRNLFKKAVTWASKNQTTVDISDVDMQIAFMLDEMEGYGYFKSDGIFVTEQSPAKIGYYLCEHYENPATDGTDAKYIARGNLAMQLFNSCNGMVGEIDYDDENIGSYIEYIEYQPDEYGYNQGQSTNASNLWFEGSDPNNLTDYDADDFIVEYLDQGGYRPANFIGEHAVANLYFENYGTRKYTLDTGDMIVWRDYAAIYIGNGKVLCVQTLDPLSKKTKIIGKYSMSKIVDIWGGSYKIIAPIKDTE